MEGTTASRPHDASNKPPAGKCHQKRFRWEGCGDAYDNGEPNECDNRNRFKANRCSCPYPGTLRMVGCEHEYYHDTLMDGACYHCQPRNRGDPLEWWMLAVPVHYLDQARNKERKRYRTLKRSKEERARKTQIHQLANFRAIAAAPPHHSYTPPAPCDPQTADPPPAYCPPSARHPQSAHLQSTDPPRVSNILHDALIGNLHFHVIDCSNMDTKVDSGRIKTSQPSINDTEDHGRKQANQEASVKRRKRNTCTERPKTANATRRRGQARPNISSAVQRPQRQRMMKQGTSSAPRPPPEVCTVM